MLPLHLGRSTDITKM